MTESDGVAAAAVTAVRALLQPVMPVTSDSALRPNRTVRLKVVIIECSARSIMYSIIEIPRKSRCEQHV